MENRPLCRHLTVANNVIAENMNQIRAMAATFDLIAEENPALWQMWQQIRLTINRDCTPEDQAELERQADHHSSELRDDLNL
ncbi:hypothetical protein YC2023_018519 [Brassica napus]